MSNSRSLRIALLHHSFGVHGGAEILVLSLARGLASRGHSVTLFTRDYDASVWGEPGVPGLQIRDIRTPERLFDADTYSFRGWAETGNLLAPLLVGFDAIVANIFPTMIWWHYAREAEPTLREIPSLWYCHGFVGWSYPEIAERHVRSALPAPPDEPVPHRGVISRVIGGVLEHGLLWAAKRAVRRFTALRNSDFADRVRELERAVIPEFDAVLANSSFTAANIRAAFGVEAAVCYPGVEFTPVQELGQRRDCILTVARLGDSKNVIAVLRAIEILKEQGTIPFSRYVIAGSGPEEATLKSYCHERGLDDLVEFVGHVSGEDKERQYRRAALFVLPCLDEGFGLVFLEAANHSIAAIGPDHGGPAEIIVPNHTGWQVDALDPAGIASAIVDAFSDPDRLAAEGRAAYDRAHELFTVDAFVHRFESSLQSLVESPPDSAPGAIVAGDSEILSQQAGSAPDAAAPEAKPMFSIVIAAFNAEDTLAETLDSVLAQTFAKWEVIVVDDGSTDRTAQVAQEYAERDSRFRVVLQANAGPSLARNAGLELARGFFICLLDADDVYLPHFLAEQQRFMCEHPGYDVYSCNVDEWLEDGSRRPSHKGSEYAAVVETRLDDLLDRNRFSVITVIRACSLREVGGFRSLPYLEDYALWLRMAAAGYRMLHNPQTLALYRLRPGTRNSNYGGGLETNRQILEGLLESTPLAPKSRAHALASLDQVKAKLARLQMEERLRSGKFAGTRRLFWRTRPLFPTLVDFVRHLVPLMLSPRIYARVLLARQSRGRSEG